MGRIVFISHRHDDLVPTIIKRVPEAVALTSFKFEIQRGDVLCWLPTVNEYVDDEVQELAELIDCSLVLPSKIVMLSIAGTADDATNQQLQEWYGQQATQAVLAHTTCLTSYMTNCNRWGCHAPRLSYPSTRPLAAP